MHLTKDSFAHHQAVDKPVRHYWYMSTPQQPTQAVNPGSSQSHNWGGGGGETCIDNTNIINNFDPPLLSCYLAIPYVNPVGRAIKKLN